MRRPLLILFLIAFVGISAGCGQDCGLGAVEAAVRASYPGVRQLSTDSLATWLRGSGPRPLLLDVRQPEEYRVSHLAGAQQVAPDPADLSFLGGVPKDAPIVTYCSVGYRSSKLTARLRKAGYANVYNLEGSIFRWANEGRPVMRDGRRVYEVHPYDRTWGALLRDSLRAREPGSASERAGN